MLKVTISPEEEVQKFSESQALEAEMITALLKDAQDKEYSEEISLWDVVAGDGIDAAE